MIGSTFSDTEVNVSNKVLNSVVTFDASITSELLMRCGEGSLGDVNEMYLLPNTVVALILASTLAGSRLMYLGSTSSVIFAFGVSPTETSSTLATRPISTPL